MRKGNGVLMCLWFLGSDTDRVSQAQLLDVESTLL